MAAGLTLGLVAGAGAGLAAGWPFAAGASTQSDSVTRDVRDHGDSAMVHEGEPGPVGNRRPHRGPGMERRHHVREILDTAATFLGLDAQELRAEMKSGKTLAEIAEANGSSRQELIDALVAAGIDAATERLNEQIPRLVDREVGPRHNS